MATKPKRAAKEKANKILLGCCSSDDDEDSDIQNLVDMEAVGERMDCVNEEIDNDSLSDNEDDILERDLLYRIEGSDQEESSSEEENNQVLRQVNCGEDGDNNNICVSKSGRE